MNSNTTKIDDYWQDALEAMYKDEIIKSQKSLSDYLAMESDYLVDPDLLGLNEFEEE